jgi:hypothetical protein
MNTKTKIFFDESGKDFILDALGKSIDSEGFITEKDDPTIRIQTPEGREITKSQLAVIMKGSQKFIAGDLTSLMKLSKGEL